jgi:hypothetical protein
VVHKSGVFSNAAALEESVELGKRFIADLTSAPDRS